MPTLTRTSSCVSDLALDMSFARELSAQEQAALNAHLDACVRCGLRRDVLWTQRAAYLERLPTWDIAGNKPKRRPLRLVAISSVVVAAAAALMLVFLPSAKPAAVRSKGGGSLGVFVKRGEQVKRAQTGDFVRPGDLLRMTYSSARPSQFALLHRDSQRASVYYPLADHTLAIAPGREVALDFGIRLDAVPGEEQLYALFCDEPTLLEPLRVALQNNGQLTTTSHCQVDSMILTKQLGAEAQGRKPDENKP